MVVVPIALKLVTMPDATHRWKNKRVEVPEEGSKILPSWPLIRSGGCVSSICRKKLPVSNKNTRVAFPSHIRGGFSFCAMLLRGCRATLCIGTAASRLVAKAGSADLADGWLQLVSRRLAYG